MVMEEDQCTHAELSFLMTVGHGVSSFLNPSSEIIFLICCTLFMHSSVAIISDSVELRVVIGCCFDDHNNGPSRWI